MKNRHDYLLLNSESNLLNENPVQNVVKTSISIEKPGFQI